MRLRMRRRKKKATTHTGRIAGYLQDLLWHERAQVRETVRVFSVFLFSIVTMILFFGVVLFVIQKYQGGDRTLIESFYFVWITFASIGYSDEGFATGTLLRVVVILVGAFLITRFIVLAAHVYARVVVEEVYNLKIIGEMEKALKNADKHFLIFGDDRELINKIIEGLIKRSQVFLVSEDREMLQDFKQHYPVLYYIMAKPTREETVEHLRPEAAAGAYLLYREDERNIMLAAMLEKRVRIISSFSGDFNSVSRFKRLGVEPISPHFSGGLKMVSSMIRPQVTEFLDRYLFPDNAQLDFRTIPHEELDNSGLYAPLAAMEEGQMVFGATSAPGGELVVIGFRDPSASTSKLGRMDSPELPLKSDKFMVLGGGIIGGTVVAELDATQRRAVVIEPSEDKLEKLRKRLGGERVEYLAADALLEKLEVGEIDGVAICTPSDEKNFTLALDFVGHEIIRVVRAVDEDMEFHYRRMGAIPVFVGRVGSGRMLREVTNQFANRVLHDMLMQKYRLDQVYINQPCTTGGLAEKFSVTPVAICRESHCYFAPEAAEQLQQGDTLIFCGRVDFNRELRLANLLSGA